LATGPAGLSPSEILIGLFGQSDSEQTLQIIMLSVRLPTACLAVLVGGSLSLAGAEMQTMLQNPLASPFTMGVSSAAAFGAALAIVFGLAIPFLPGSLAIPANAFLFAFVAAMIIHLVAATTISGPAVLVLFGIALVFAFNALVSVIQFMAPADTLQQLVFWTLGSLSRADGVSTIAIAGTIALVFPFSLRAAWELTLLQLGEERAQSLGISLQRLRFGCLLRASLLASAAVAFTGTIGFVGLVGPHIARMLVGEDHRYFLPAAMLTGAAIMSLSSIAAKLVLPGVLLPVGIVTTLVGLPLFVVLLFREQRS
jgi:iron complex transport system permease protein